ARPLPRGPPALVRDGVLPRAPPPERPPRRFGHPAEEAPRGPAPPPRDRLEGALGHRLAFHGRLLHAGERRRLPRAAAPRGRQAEGPLRQRRAPLPGGLKEPMPNDVLAVLGAGTMGRGIAQAAAQAGCEVRLFDVVPEILEAGRAAALAGIARFE